MVVLALTCLLGLGYTSNLVSLRRCQAEAARSLASGFQEDKRVYWYGQGTKVNPRDLFGPGTTVLTNEPPVIRGEKAWDPVLVLEETRAWVPFVVTIDYTWSTGGLRGGTGTYWYGCLFGALVIHGDRDTGAF
jgi:hypothetical protein